MGSITAVKFSFQAQAHKSTCSYFFLPFLPFLDGGGALANALGSSTGFRSSSFASRSAATSPAPWDPFTFTASFIFLRVLLLLNACVPYTHRQTQSVGWYV